MPWLTVKVCRMTLFLPPMLCLSLAGCSSPVDAKQAIVGSWKTDSGTEEWTFNADGTAVELLTKTGKETKYTYQIVDADKIDLTSQNPANNMHSQYQFDGKDRLTLLLGSEDYRPTRIAEAVKASDIRLAGKGGGLVAHLRRK